MHKAVVRILGDSGLRGNVNFGRVYGRDWRKLGTFCASSNFSFEKSTAFAIAIENVHIYILELKAFHCIALKN